MEPQKVKLSPEASQFLQSFTMIDSEWYFVPFWFKKIGEDTFEVHSLEKLPKNLKKRLEINREQL